jgi:hypothetical protein
VRSGREEFVAEYPGLGKMFPGGAAFIHTTDAFIVSMIWVCMYELERLVEGVPFEVLHQNRD